MRLNSIRLAVFLCASAGILSACGDDATSSSNLIKGGMTVAGAAGGAYAGSQLSSGSNKTLGTVLGAAAGGGLGYVAGGAVGGK